MLAATLGLLQFAHEETLFAPLLCPEWEGGHPMKYRHVSRDVLIVGQAEPVQTGTECFGK